MRKKVIAANWKMFKTPEETEFFLKTFLPQIPKSLSADVVICPPFTSLATAHQMLKGSPVSLGAPGRVSAALPAVTRPRFHA